MTPTSIGGEKQAGISEVCANGIAGVGAGHNVFGATMVMAVFPELYAILALLVVILIGGTLPV